MQIVSTDREVSMHTVRLPHPFTPNLKVVVLAGTNTLSDRRRQLRDERRAFGREEVPLDNKAFLPLRGQLVVEHVLEWLQGCGLERVWVLALQESLDRIDKRYHFTPLAQPPRSTLATNLAAAHAALVPEANEPVLVVFGDHPLNTPRALNDFLAGCAPDLDEADLFHAVALKEAYAEFAPWSTRTSVHMREFCGRVTGMTLAIPSRLHRPRVTNAMYHVRKQEQRGQFVILLWSLVERLRWRSPHALLDAVRMYLAKSFEVSGRRRGPTGTVARAMGAFFRRQVPLRRIEYYGQRLIQAERGMRLIPIAHGGTALDVDFIEELRTLDEHWERLREIALRQAERSAARDQEDSGTTSSAAVALR